MKAIKTKYIGPTNSRGSRIVATTEDHNRLITEWDSSLNSEENHQIAARMLCEKMGWNGKLATGSFPGYDVHVFIADHTTFEVKKTGKAA